MAVKPGSIPDDVFVETWRREGNGPRTAKALGISERWAHTKRKQLSARGYELPTRPEIGYEVRVPDEYRNDGWTYEPSRHLEIDTGTVVVFSDAHVWPGEPSTAAKALIKVIKDLRPRAVIANGDIFDGGGIGRHDPFGWSVKPTVKQELEACQELLGKIEQARPRGCELVYTIGNHELRFERNLARAIPEYAGMGMLRLAHHFDAWDMAWKAPINWHGNCPVMVKHRHKGGIHAGFNNAREGGVSIVTGHTHTLDVTPFGNYRTSRFYGVQTGTLQDLNHPTFEYMEGGPPGKACSGFAVLTFVNGELLPPELCQVIGGKAWFRSEVVV